MRLCRWSMSFVMLVAVAALVGCAATAEKSPDVTATVRSALDQAGLKTVSVSQDCDKGVVTLGGQVGSDRGQGPGRVTGEVHWPACRWSRIRLRSIPVGSESDAKTVNADLDRGIEQNLDAA